MPIGSSAAGYNPGFTVGFDVGKDVVVNVVDPTTGQVITFNNVVDFDSQQLTKQLESAPMGSPPLYAEIPNGWSGTFTIDRANSNADQMFARLEKLYWTIGAAVLYGSITEYINEFGGVVNQFRYTNVVYKLDNAGSKKSQDKITMKISFRASTRDQITS